MRSLLRKGIAAEMIDSACKVVLEKGIGTRNAELLKKGLENEHLSVKGTRIFVSPEILKSCLKKLSGARVPSGEKLVQQHDWKDMIINRGDDHEVVIKLTDLPYQFCDHMAGKIVPLSREQVVSGTKLMHVLSEKKNIRGYSCGVPQDTHPCLKAIEQYLIGFRFNINGGGTIQSVAPEVEEQFSEIRSIAESWEDPKQRDLMLFSPSPMLLDAEDLYLCFREGVRLNSFMVGSMPMMGMTGPVDPVGVYILALAEVIGAASVLHAFFPDAGVFVYPHPQAMSLETGQMAFGTVEHARLEMMKLEIMEALGLTYYNLKDIMTSAQMPGAMAQGDKALGFYTGIMAGYRAFNLMPLSTDQVWSPVQALLDIENLQNAWKSMDQSKIGGDCGSLTDVIMEVIDAKSLFAEHSHTLINMFDNYELEVWQRRHFSSETWGESGEPHELRALEHKVDEFTSTWEYRPPQDKLEKISDIYMALCRKYNTEPLNLD